MPFFALNVVHGGSLTFCRSSLFKFYKSKWSVKRSVTYYFIDNELHCWKCMGINRQFIARKPSHSSIFSKFEPQSYLRQRKRSILMIILSYSVIGSKLSGSTFACQIAGDPQIQWASWEILLQNNKNLFSKDECLVKMAQVVQKTL